MEKSSAARIVRQTFQNPFDKESFVYFIKNLLNHIEPAPFIYRGNFIPDAYEPYIKTLERIGKYQDKDGKKIDLLIVRLKKETSLERARTMQRNFIAWYLNGSRGDVLKDAALVAFVSPDSDDWRFSLVKMDYRLDASGEKVRVKQELTPARRFSFLVGKTESSHTAQSRLVPILQDDSRDPTLRDLEEAFSIEKVTKEFFEKYRQLFHEVKEALDEAVKKDKKVQQDFKEKNIDTVNFAKKLLGQIVFLYFLQKKGWFGVERDKDWGIGPKNFLRLLFEKEIANYGNFFNEILEPLFYNTLAVERTDDYSDRFNCKIPFLNGGLFDPLNNYDWVHTDILLPNELFSNNIKTKEGDIGTGILDIFDRYNFTVKEDEPLEKEVAVDPEMLGKVFENLLEVKDRKSKGTYYTPREIVHYMCQQSLINYLATELRDKVVKKDIETLIKYGETAVEHDSQVVNKGKETKRYFYKLPQNIRDYAKLIDEKLASIRVCDPAVGSGAFPVGMMNEIIRARNVLTNYIKDKKGRTIYDFKRHAIQNCLYGVDIDPGAVEIAKLRLWLSLIVDEEDIKQIKPLPNLDYKIVCGNSLLGVEKNLFNQKLFTELEQLKPLYFNETNARKKQEYKNQIDELINQITNGRKDFDFEVYFSEVFHEKGGFDVVIANPPYGNILTPQEKKDISKKYKSYTGEIAAIFIEKYLNLLREHGVVVNIITLALAYHISLSHSRYLLQNNFKKTILFTFDRDPVGLFGAMSQSVCIFLSSDYKKDCNGRFYTSKFLRTTREIVDNIDLVIRNLPVQLANNHLLGDKIGVSFTEKHRLPKIGDKIAVNILNKIKKQPIQIKDIISKKGEKLIIRTSGNYWYNSFDKKPYKSVEIKEIYVENLYYRNFLLVLINSSLFYLFGRIYGDGRHLPIGFLGLFSIPDEEEIINYSKEIKTLSEKFMEQLFSVFNLKSRQFQSSQIKHSIDRLDKFLAKIYHFSKEELEYILNYDSCIRNKKIQECAPN